MKKPMRLNVQIGRDSPKTGLEDSPLQISMKQKTRECKSELRERRDTTHLWCMSQAFRIKST